MDRTVSLASLTMFILLLVCAGEYNAFGATVSGRQPTPADGSNSTKGECDDGNACTEDIEESEMLCIHAFVDCNDDNPVTIDTCDSYIGCVNTPDFNLLDPNLQQALRYNLDLGPTEPITEVALAEILVLDAGSYSIVDLTGLEYCTSLMELNLGDNQISDLTPLSGLTSLTWLGLAGNQISDLTPLAGLTSLKWLDLYDNQISDLTPLAGLANLLSLFLYWNCISDLSPLLGLPLLNYLDIDSNPLSESAITVQIAQLEGNGVDVFFETYSDANCPAASVPDPNLQQAIRDNLGLDPTDPITETALAEITTLDAGFYSIVDLTGLEYCTSLTDLCLNGNQISDLTPLSGLTSLTWLFLDGNQISDLAPLSGLTGLTELWLCKNQICDVTPLLGLANLRALFLYVNCISDLSPLLGLPLLNYLDIDFNPLSESAITVQIAQLEGNGVDVYFETYSNANCPAVSVPDPNLQQALRNTLGLGPTDLITGVALAGITVLNAGGQGITDLTGLEYCTSLSKLSLFNNQISDLTPLAGLTSLTVLELFTNQISDLSPLSGLTNLEVLILSTNQISDLSPLSGLTSLTELYLGHIQISDLSPLSGLTSLTTLWLSGNQINDLTPLAGLTSLTELGLEQNCISDLSPLLGLPYLHRLYIDSNPLGDPAITIQIPQFEDNGVDVEFYTYSDANCPAAEGEGEGEAHPADSNADWRIGLSEAIAYLAGWQQGANPIGHAIRAAYIWQNGEGYFYNGSLEPPMCWELLETETILLPGEVPLELVRIPAGSFQMGSPDTERNRWADEGPVHTVTINYDFYMGKYEVTQAQWLAVMGSSPGGYTWDYGQGDSYPAYYVSWDDAQVFITALNTHITNTGQGPATVRLPSEAEWEYACRAGTQTRFYFGDSLSVGDDCEDDGVRRLYIWYCGNNPASGEPGYGSKPVGGKLANPFGLHDMSGNLWEWCEDDWHGSYTGAPSTGSAWTGAPRGEGRVGRGGGWSFDARDCRSAYRIYNGPDYREETVGFRLAR